VIAAEFKLGTKRVKEIAERVERHDRGAEILRLEPSKLEGLELIGKIPRLVRISLQARGIERLEDLDGMSLRDLLGLPNVGRLSATTLIDLCAEHRRRAPRPHPGGLRERECLPNWSQNGRG
jgi:hypothetical protein